MTELAIKRQKDDRDQYFILLGAGFDADHRVKPQCLKLGTRREAAQE